MTSTPSILSEIVARKKRDVAERKRRVPHAQLRLDLQPSQRSLADALSQPRAQLICECKKASPSQGVIREPFDPCEVATAYAPFAAAMSVITDEPFFQGSLDFIRQARQAFGGPILCKDFVVDSYQVAEARKHDADAVLIMLSVLDDDTARACLAAAARWNMDALVEVHNEHELQRAHDLDATIVGINNRNLHTLDVDLETSERLAPQVIGDRIVVAESGIRSRADLLRLGPHVDAFLVGTSLMREPDIGRGLRQLLFGRVKVCGLTNPEDAEQVWRRGGSWGGLIFASRSPRRVDVRQAAAIRAAAPLKWAGVFVDAPIEQVVAIAEELSLDAVQLHGGEQPAYRKTLQEQLKRTCALWQAVPVDATTAREENPQQATDAISARAENAGEHATRVLFDSRLAATSQSGGTGAVFDHTLLDTQLRRSAVLAGGLKPQNIAAAAEVGCWALDVNSGVESSPRKKSHEAIERLFEQLRPTCRGSQTT